MSDKTERELELEARIESLEGRLKIAEGSAQAARGDAYSLRFHLNELVNVLHYDSHFQRAVSRAQEFLREPTA